MRTEFFDFNLTPDRIAQAPVEPRDQSGLLFCSANGRMGEFSGSFQFKDLRFKDIADILTADDFLVVNDAKVLPIRLLGKSQGGGNVECLILKRTGALEANALMNMSAKARPGLRVRFEPGLEVEVLSTHEERLANNGTVRVRFHGVDHLEHWLMENGHVPLPPYIERKDGIEDKKNYQTVYANKSGSAAAPTAGFHFTEELIAKLKDKGVGMASVTLHVGIGTFRPIKSENIEDHPMHEESFEISEEFIRALQNAKKEGKRIVAVGTTVVRTLESLAATSEIEAFRPGTYTTSAYIRPGHRFKVVDDLITNFHLPKSSLLVLVAAGMGLDAMKAAYAHALAGSYRFFSYGDAMFIRGGK